MSPQSCEYTGLGTFTCCTRNHQIDGRHIKCDREVIGPIVYTMLEKRCESLARENELHRMRVWRCFTPFLMRNLTCDKMPSPTWPSTDAFLRDPWLRYCGPCDEARRGADYL